MVNYCCLFGAKPLPEPMLTIVQSSYNYWTPCSSLQWNLNQNKKSSSKSVTCHSRSSSSNAARASQPQVSQGRHPGWQPNQVSHMSLKVIIQYGSQSKSVTGHPRLSSKLYVICHPWVMPAKYAVRYDDKYLLGYSFWLLMCFFQITAARSSAAMVLT